MLRPILIAKPSFKFILLSSLWLFTSIASSAPALTGQESDLSLPVFNQSLLEHGLVPRDDWFKPRWPGVWTGSVTCPNLTNTSGISLALATNGYNLIMRVPTEKRYNLVAAFCISGLKCYMGSIPDRHQFAKNFVNQQVGRVPEWQRAFGATTDSTEFHAEDLALALAAEAGVRFPYVRQVPTNGNPVMVKGRMKVYGQYTDKIDGGDGKGPIGVRWPCTAADRDRRPAACFATLSALQLVFDYQQNGLTVSTT